MSDKPRYNFNNTREAEGDRARKAKERIELRRKNGETKKTHNFRTPERSPFN